MTLKPALRGEVVTALTELNMGATNRPIRVLPLLLRWDRPMWWEIQNFLHVSYGVLDMYVKKKKDLSIVFLGSSFVS